MCKISQRFWTLHWRIAAHLPERSKAILIRQYAHSEAENRKLDEKISFQLKAGMIEHSDSDYSSPIFGVPKKNGEIRLVQDLRALNKVVRNVLFQMPTVSETIRAMGSSRIFSSIDLVDSYNQLPLDDESKKLTAFSTRRGHF